ncbi:LLM class oxidoreductase [Pseudoalteromonas sp. SaAl2]
MAHNSQQPQFQTLNKGYNSVFKLGSLSVGLVVPIESYPKQNSPSMRHHLERVKLAEKLGFSAVWLRDVPFNVPSFGDAGQLFDPFTYLGFLAAQTSEIALGVASIVLPLRHPAHVAKSAASVDVLSQGRLLLGVASGDRPQEYPAMQLQYENRGERFAQSVDYIRQMQTSNPVFKNDYGQFNGEIDMLPKATSGKIPLLITGQSQQSDEWIAQHADGRMLYPHKVELQRQLIGTWQQQLAALGRGPQPVMQPLYFDLAGDNEAPSSLHLGLRASTEYLVNYLMQLEQAGVNHVALNLRFNQADITDTLHLLAENVLPHFRNNHYE